MSKRKSSPIMPIFFLKLNLFFCFAFLMLACNEVEIKSNLHHIVTPEVSEVPTHQILNDTGLKLQTVKPISLKEAPSKKVAIAQIKKQEQIRQSEGLSDAKLNGEPILLQEELAENILVNNPDTIKQYLKQIYLGQSRNFPRSIADDFEHGVSREYISYPILNFRVELFEDAYAMKPYRILGYAVRKENDLLIVE